jgi:hypothetical protein
VKRHELMRALRQHYDKCKLAAGSEPPEKDHMYVQHAGATCSL